MRTESNKTEMTELYREYNNLRGMSLSKNARPDERFAYAINMYVDYEGDFSGIESIPGYRKIYDFDKKIHSMAIQTVGKQKYLIIHAGEELYRIDVSQRDALTKPTPIATLEGDESYSFAFGSIALITDRKRLLTVTDRGEARLVSEGGYITGCTACAIFDGRIFMSGNPEFPERIFYSSRLAEAELSFLEDDYLTVGVGGAKVLSLLSRDGGLWVFRSADDGDGAIICYKAEGEKYSVSRVFSALCPTGQVCSADGKIVFLTEGGLLGIERAQESDPAKIKLLSSDITSLLSREEMKSASLTLWRGYVVIGCGERLYLADTRGELGYDWYLISGVGGHENDRRVFRYQGFADEGYSLHRFTDAPAESQVLSLVTEDKRTVYYTEEGKEKYAVYPTEEFFGGELIPEKAIISDGSLLWFYTERGGLYLFNSDKRGFAPDCVRSDPNFDEESYERLYGRKIHPIFYSFDRHAPKHLLLTCPDSCGFSDLVKLSQGNSLTLRLDSSWSGELSVSVIADGRITGRQTLKRYSVGTEGASDGEKLIKITQKHSLCERAPAWQEKQILIESKEFCSPFGVSGVSFRYRTKDKIKKG